MFESAYIFTRGLLTFEYEVPIPLQIAAYIIIGIIITILVYIYKDALDISVLRDQYMWYYFVACFNIINICAVLAYYYFKRGTYIGDAGAPGHRGPAGYEGTASSCSLCEQKIYMVPSTSYDTIAKMDFISLANRIINPDLASSLASLETVFANQQFDYGEFTNNIINGTFDANNELTSKLILLSIYNEYPLIQHLNETMGLSDSEATGYFKFISSNPGYFGLSDMAFGGSEPFNPTGFTINGDIRSPVKSEVICTFATVQDSGNIAKYNILKLNALDSVSSSDNDKYVSLGNIIQPADVEPDLQRYALVKAKCTKKLSSSKLKLVFIYPGASYELAHKSTEELNRVGEDSITAAAGKSGLMQTEGFFSVWRTPFSTVHVKYVAGHFHDNKSIIENIYLDGEVIPEAIYTKHGTIKRTIIERVSDYLNKIRLPKVIFGTYLFGYVVEKVKTELKQFVEKYVVSGLQTIMPTTALKKCQAPDTLLLSDISQALKDIADSIQAGYDAKLAAAEAEMAKTSKKRIRSFLDIDTPKEASDLDMDYKMIKDYESIKNIIQELSIKIENGKTLNDLFLAVFPGGLSSKIYSDKLLPTQERLLNMICTLIPPETDIYILKNDCLAYEHIDENRQEISFQLEDALKRLKLLTTNLNNISASKKGKKAKSASPACSESNIEEINKQVGETYEFISRNLGHIPDYIKKLESANFEDFTTDKLITVAGQINRLIKFIESRCLPQ